jgi:hypothetical protein
VPLCSRVPLGNLTGLQLVKKFPAFYGTRRFLTDLTSARHLTFRIILSPEETSRTHECYKTAVHFTERLLLPPRPTLKLEDHSSSAFRDCLFNLIAATFHTGGLSSIRNLRTRHAVVTGTHLHGLHTYSLAKLLVILYSRSGVAQFPTFCVAA